MASLFNYYQREPRKNETMISERFPHNHVKFSALLKPLEWIDGVCGLFGSRAFKFKDAMLHEFDSASPLDDCLGTKAELKQVKEIIMLFCKGIDNNPHLSSIGRFLIRKIGLDTLKKRKRVLTYYYSNKKFIEANGKVKAPVIITGLPRSGTTLLQRLMSEDTNTRSPYTYEMEAPTPPLKSGADPFQDPRIKKESGSALNTLILLAPGLVEKYAESHFWSALEKEESFIYMLAHNGIIEPNSSTAGRAYINSLVKIWNKRPIFRYERLFFTMLDAYCPPQSHWILKAPNYAPCFPLIFEEYPDARVIVTHRTPLVTIPSICRQKESWCIVFDKDGSFDKHRFGQLELVNYKHYASAPLNYRKEHREKEKQIFDCVYKEFFSDPIMMVKKIYQKFDLEYTDKFEERMKVYLKNNQQGKYGRHKYSLEEYGFTRENIYKECKDYMDYYGFGMLDHIERPASFNFLKKR
jgi:hypothetical protein